MWSFNFSSSLVSQSQGVAPWGPWLTFSFFSPGSSSFFCHWLGSVHNPGHAGCLLGGWLDSAWENTVSSFPMKRLCPGPVPRSPTSASPKTEPWKGRKPQQFCELNLKWAWRKAQASPGSLKDLLGESTEQPNREAHSRVELWCTQEEEVQAMEDGVSSCHCPTEWELQWLLQPDILTEDRHHIARPGKDSDLNIKIPTGICH